MMFNLVKVFLVLLIFGFAPADVLGTDSGSTTATVIRTTFLARDLDPMLALYRDILGYELVYRDEYQGQTFRRIFEIDENAAVEFAILKPPTDSGGSIGVLTIRDDLASSIPQSDYAPEFGQAILFSNTDNLDAIYKRVLAADATIVSVVAPPFATQGGREMVIADANGIRIYVFEREKAKLD